MSMTRREFAKAQAAGEPIAEYTRRYTEAFFEDLATLRVERAERYPAATGHIPEMVALIRRLEGAGHTFGIVHPWQGPTPMFDRVLSESLAWFATHLP